MQNLDDFRFGSRCERAEIMRCCRRRGWVWRWCSAVARKTDKGWIFWLWRRKQSCRRQRYLE